MIIFDKKVNGRIWTKKNWNLEGSKLLYPANENSPCREKTVFS